MEKFKLWSDSGEKLEQTISQDDLLTNIMVYLVTDTIDSSIWFYRGVLDEMLSSFILESCQALPVSWVRVIVIPTFHGKEVEESASVLSALGGVVTLRRYPGLPHTINHDKIEQAKNILRQLVAKERAI